MGMSGAAELRMAQAFCLSMRGLIDNRSSVLLGCVSQLANYSEMHSNRGSKLQEN